MEAEYIIEMDGISKRFGGVQALKNVELKIVPGEVHALMGENGAGKSTLMKILGGVYTCTEGVIKINGEEVRMASPIEAMAKGIAVVYQEQALVDSLSVADNILLGHVPSTLGWINKKELLKRAKKALDMAGANFNLNGETGALTVAQKQFIEIAKALSRDAKVIVMDEPTSVLTLSETRTLFALIRSLKEKGISIIYISHRMDEIFEICDRCTVLKDGAFVDTVEIKDVDKARLISMMTGREIANIYPAKDRNVKKEEVLRVEHLSKKSVFEDVSFAVSTGEIVGMSGLVGAGRSEVCRAIAGIDRLESGEIFLNGKKLNIKKPEDAIANGIAYVSEDRKSDGLNLKLSIESNITMTTVKKYAAKGFINKKKESKAINRMMKLLDVKAGSIHQSVSELSGGNQQKVMLANWMLVGAKVMIIDEPTRGVDVGTKVEIYKIIRNLADSGTAVLVISSELPEVLGICDRILVMREGRLAGEIDAQEANEENVLTMATC